MLARAQSIEHMNDVAVKFIEEAKVIETATYDRALERQRTLSESYAPHKYTFS